ncbi:MAG: hypothetical protein IT210_02550 [Armatimonadetes bacterium]|nr:hypothetical protein [Armatimonadota bacterium]
MQARTQGWTPTYNVRNYPFLLDARRITRGGLFLDRSHSEALQSFARNFRALPREKFQLVGVSNDPVTVRSLLHDGLRYVCLVNREYYPIPVTLDFSRPPLRLTDPAAGEALPADASWNIVLGPYSLRSFAVEPETAVTGFTARPHEEIARPLLERSREALACLQAEERPLPGLEAM